MLIRGIFGHRGTETQREPPCLRASVAIQLQVHKMVKSRLIAGAGLEFSLQAALPGAGDRKSVV